MKGLRWRGAKLISSPSLNSRSNSSGSTPRSIKSLKHENILRFCSSEVDEGNKTINMITELFTSRSMMIYLWRKVEAKAIKN
ncbi:hypothetical protein SAY87_023591 [Trapa incisa]|uniref:non-specific serine/threonine protein kinase n=1 Tax=Trapa incisa TaxID=236973 RepID=A0AAN7L5W2_9MYRT|nr:hypothetical protein SAY87_023591 [Trapa incisa]